MRPIDADALIEKCGDWYVEEGTESGFIGTLKNLLATEQTIQPEQMEGEWVPVHPLQSDDPGAYMCSKCKTGMWEIRPSSYHYCPHCGARMTISTK